VWSWRRSDSAATSSAASDLFAALQTVCLEAAQMLNPCFLLANANSALRCEAVHVAIAADWIGSSAARYVLWHCCICIEVMPSRFDLHASDVSHHDLHVYYDLRRMAA
jgi:hypothetical protein